MTTHGHWRDIWGTWIYMMWTEILLVCPVVTGSPEMDVKPEQATMTCIAHWIFLSFIWAWTSGIKLLIKEHYRTENALFMWDYCSTEPSF